MFLASLSFVLPIERSEIQRQAPEWAGAWFGFAKWGLLSASLFILNPSACTGGARFVWLAPNGAYSCFTLYSESKRLHGRGADTRPPSGGQARVWLYQTGGASGVSLYPETKRLHGRGAFTLQDKVKHQNPRLLRDIWRGITAPERGRVNRLNEVKPPPFRAVGGCLTCLLISLRSMDKTHG